MAPSQTNDFYGAVIAQRPHRAHPGGNTRYKSAEAAGMTTVPVIWVDVDDEHALRILIADNRTARLGHDDPTALTELLAELSNASGLEGTGFDGDDLDALIQDLAGPMQSAPSTGGSGYDSFSQQQDIQKSGQSGKSEKSQFGVLVLCDDEGEQRVVFDELKDEGRTVLMQGVPPKE